MEIYFIFELVKKKLGQLAKNFSPKTLSLGSQKYGLGTGKNLFRSSDPGVKKVTDPGFGSATLVITGNSCNWPGLRIRELLYPNPY
jgi:hypothetical protein